MDRIRISIPESEENWNRGGWFESLCQRFESLWKKKLQIYTPRKKGIFVHILDIFWLRLFLTKMKIRSKTFWGSRFQIISSWFLCQKWIERSYQNLLSRKLQKAKCEGWFESLFQNVEKMDPRWHWFKSLREGFESQVQKIVHND